MTSTKSLVSSVLGAMLVAGFLAMTSMFAQEPSVPAAPKPIVAAQVDGVPVYNHEVESELQRVLRGREVEPADLPLLQAQTLQQLVDRQMILGYLAEFKLGASGQDVDLGLERVKAQLARQNKKLADYLALVRGDEASLRRTLAWEIGWRRFLDQQLTDVNLQKHFSAHRRDFDGTELRVAHILLKVDRPDDAVALAAASDRAAALRADLVAGKVTFAAAAAQHSQAPTAANGGDIGWIGRHDPMPESFSRAAFALLKGEISPPVTSKFGVHLIQCTDEKPGKLGWEECRAELTEAVTLYLFTWAADRQRPKAKVVFTGALPYFKPGTREVVTGK